MHYHAIAWSERCPFCVFAYRNVVRVRNTIHAHTFTKRVDAVFVCDCCVNGFINAVLMVCLLINSLLTQTPNLTPSTPRSPPLPPQALRVGGGSIGGLGEQGIKHTDH